MVVRERVKQKKLRQGWVWVGVFFLIKNLYLKLNAYTHAHSSAQTNREAKHTPEHRKKEIKRGKKHYIVQTNEICIIDDGSAECLWVDWGR